MKRNRPSGSQHRKIKKAKEKSAEAMSGSILKYVAPSTSTAVGESAEDIQSVESRGEMPEVSSQEASYGKAQELEKIILSSSGESDVDEGDAISKTLMMMMMMKKKRRLFDCQFILMLLLGQFQFQMF
ncbi:Hypothetical predicted protein [Pelobates cultripes]|uniref:Uncharacterized protein n=1 Tax=Pelobates cultripes TaxID=61616 RepID=A0AAD1S2S8_PELCU|nr:Hypothetical predicted protein [Pelobates cultripes]